MQTVEFMTFAKHRRFGRIQILRLARIDDARAKTDYLASHIANRKHHSPAKPVVALAFLGYHQACFDELRIVVVVKGSTKRLPTVGRISERETRRALTTNATPLQICDGCRAVFKLKPVKLGCARQDIRQRARFRMSIRSALGLGNLHAGTVRQVADRIDVALPAVLHHESDRTAMGAATEAVKKLLR